MNEEIKIRCYPIKKKQYLDLLRIDFMNAVVDVMEIVGEIRFSEFEVAPDYAEVQYKFDEVILERYSTVKDEDGMEIYEGDKIERPDCWPIRTGIVAFKEGKFVGVFPEDKMHKWEAETICFPFRTEVVGHIHDEEK